MSDEKPPKAEGGVFYKDAMQDKKTGDTLAERILVKAGNSMMVQLIIFPGMVDRSGIMVPGPGGQHLPLTESRVAGLIAWLHQEMVKYVVQQQGLQRQTPILAVVEGGKKQEGCEAHKVVGCLQCNPIGGGDAKPTDTAA